MQGFPPYNRIISKRMKQQISDGGKLKMKKLVIAAALVLILATGATAMAAGTVPVLRKDSQCRMASTFRSRKTSY